MPSLRLPSWSFAVALPVALSGCVVHCGHDDYEDDGWYDDDGSCNGGKCYDDDGGGNYSSQGGGTTDGGGGQGGQGGEGAGLPTCDSADAICACGPDVASCADGLTCVSGICLDACTFDYECGEGKVCGNGECIPTCDAETPCDAGYACVGGGCLADPANPTCELDATCAELSPGQICSEGFCTQSCTVHTDCPTGKLCNAVTGACRADLAPLPMCDDTTACSGTGQACLDGTCHYECTELTDCKLIDARFDYCDQNVCKTELEMNPECTAATPCDGAACVSNVCVE